MKISRKIIYSSLFIIVLFFVFATLSEAAASYKFLVNDLPGIGSSAGSTGDIGNYIKLLYKLGVSLATGLAVIMVIWGGVEYMTTDAWGKKENGKERISSALFGLLLALTSYVLLRTIDENFVNLSLFNNIDSLNDEINNLPSIPGINNLPNNGNLPNVNPGNEYLYGDQNGNYFITPDNLALDTDGKTPPPFNDPDWQNQTSYSVNGQYLDANKDFYVVVPIDSDIPLGTQVHVYDHTSNISTVAIVGDRGPAYGEISLALAQHLGAWSPGMGNSILPHQITYVFQTGSNQ